jgi:hypothetical protein
VLPLQAAMFQPFAHCATTSASIIHPDQAVGIMRGSYEVAAGLSKNFGLQSLVRQQQASVNLHQS